MKAVAFTYRARHGSNQVHEASIGSTIQFSEQMEYVLSFAEPLPATRARRITSLGGDMLRPDTAVLSFGNFVGRTELFGVVIDVISLKIGSEGVSRLLTEVSELASALVFGWRGRVGFDAMTDKSHLPPVPYHQLQYLRRSMLGQRTGLRLQDWLAAIERSPTRKFEPDRPIVRPDQVRRLDQRATASIFSRLDRLVPVPAGATLAGSPLATALTFGTPPRAHFPAKIAAPRGRLSFDTTENRFAKHVLRECLALIYRFVDHRTLHEALREDCRTMLGILTNLNDAPFFAEVGRLSHLLAPTQALAKADGYREVFGFWMELSRHTSLPRHPAETAQLLDGRDMASLYEYWVFVKVLEATIAVSNQQPSGPPSVKRDEFGESLSIGLSLGVGADISVRFNPTFRRSAGTAYSTPLRPDVIVETATGVHAFDAKYRLDRFNVDEGDPDDDPATYKRADLYKMHTYRDAVLKMKTAFVVYPGSEFVFFERFGTRRSDPTAIQSVDGVGAIPLRPADPDPAVTLRRVLAALLPESPGLGVDLA
jgi:uncharacterized protein DUF2357/PD-(D/E)XK nuclease superfamily protein